MIILEDDKIYSLSAYIFSNYLTHMESLRRISKFEEELARMIRLFSLIFERISMRDIFELSLICVYILLYYYLLNSFYDSLFVVSKYVAHRVICFFYFINDVIYFFEFKISRYY